MPVLLEKVVTLTAIPAHDELLEAEAIFTGWSGDCTGEAESCQVTMDAAKQVTATFAPLTGEEEPPVEEPPTEEEPPGEPPTEEPPATPPPAPPPFSGPQSPIETPRVSLAAAAAVAPVEGAVAFVKLRCSGQTACRGVAKLLARVRVRWGARRSAAKNVMLGQSRFRVPAGKAKLLRVRLNGKGRQLLRRSGRRGLRARLSGPGVRNRMVRFKPGQGTRRNVRSRKR